MANLIVKPINLSDPGSYRERKRYLRLMKRLQESTDDQDALGVLNVLEEADDLLRARLRTDDGTPVEDALDKLSANDFDSLISAIAFENAAGEAKSATESAVGEANGLSSVDGTEDGPKRSRRGKSR